MSFRPPPISNPKQAMLLAGEMLILKTVLEAFFMGLCVFLLLFIFDTLCARSTLASGVGCIFRSTFQLTMPTKVAFCIDDIGMFD